MTNQDSKKFEHTNHHQQKKYNYFRKQERKETNRHDGQRNLNDIKLWIIP